MRLMPSVGPGFWQGKRERTPLAAKYDDLYMFITKIYPKKFGLYLYIGCPCKEVRANGYIDNTIF